MLTETILLLIMILHNYVVIKTVFFNHERIMQVIKSLYVFQYCDMQIRLLVTSQIVLGINRLTNDKTRPEASRLNIIKPSR